MAKNIHELRAMMVPESLARIDIRVKRTLELMKLHELRRNHQREQNKGISPLRITIKP